MMNDFGRAWRVALIFCMVASLCASRGAADETETGSKSEAVALYETALQKAALVLSETARNGRYSIYAWGKPFPEFEPMKFMLGLYRERQDVVHADIFSNIAALSRAQFPSINPDDLENALIFEAVDTPGTAPIIASYIQKLRMFNETLAATEMPPEQQQELLSLRNAVLEHEKRRLNAKIKYLAGLKGDSRDLRREALAEIEAVNTELRNAEPALARAEKNAAAISAGTIEALFSFHRQIKGDSPFVDQCPQVVATAIGRVTGYSRGYGKTVPDPSAIPSCVPVYMRLALRDLPNTPQLYVAAFLDLTDGSMNILNMRPDKPVDAPLVYQFEAQGALSKLQIRKLFNGADFE